MVTDSMFCGGIARAEDGPPAGEEVGHYSDLCGSRLCTAAMNVTIS